ncbi:MAG: cytochrome c biogenesis protein CcdA [Pyrinomonadaceae bacterium]
MENFIGNLQGYLSGGSILAYPAAYAAGVLISFTPCVYPIIPIQLGFIGGRTAANNEGVEKTAFSLNGFTLSVLFVIGMSVVYAALGAFAGLTGTLFGSWAASPWTFIIVGNIVLIMALSMFGIFSLQVPHSLTRWNPAKKGKGYLSALLIGASSGLIVGPCTAPALGATLAFVGTQGNILFAVSVLFAFAFGMGSLMILLGSFGGLLRFLPRSGRWMTLVKIIFGILLLIAAQYLFIEAGRRYI